MAPTGMAPTDGAAFTLRRDTGTLAEGAAKLASDLGSVSVEAVLAAANRTGVRKGASGAIGSMQPKPVEWYAYDAADEDTVDWYPQGLTSGEDSGSVGVPLLLSSWYFKPTAGERGIRVTFFSPQTLKYRHALLVLAKPDGSYGPINIHAGGVALHGSLLFVPDTTHGLRVFDLDRILDLRTAQSDVGDPERIGRSGGRFNAFGYRYVIPQTDSWRVATAGARFSFASIDRTTSPHTLITGEYVEGSTSGRVARWNLEMKGGAPKDAFVMGQQKIQGAVSRNGVWYLSQAGDSNTNGKLHVWKSGAFTTRPYPVGPEDLTVQGGKLWSITEFKDRRVMFAVNP